jgi:RimJ/RimL family protein N-acetyltransferase
MSDGHTVELVDVITGTPALSLAIQGWAETNAAGLGEGILNCHASHKAILGWAQNGRDLLPVGVLTFDDEPLFRRVWIYQAFVLQEFRGRGVYTAMWAKLVEHSVETLKARSIQYATHLRNSAMRAAAKRTGCIEEAVHLRFNLE